MANNNCPSCNDWGGNWPISMPFSGGPFPQRTWSRSNGGCNRFSLLQQYSNHDLNMRRKGNVLQHANNKNNWTKNERFAWLAKQKSQGPILCSQNEVIYNPSDCSDVPGNEILYNDINVPLINLKTRRQYSDGGSENIPVHIIDCDNTHKPHPHHGPTPPLPPGPQPQPQPSPSALINGCFLPEVGYVNWINWVDEIADQIPDDAFLQINNQYSKTNYIEDLKKMVGFVNLQWWNTLISTTEDPEGAAYNYPKKIDLYNQTTIIQSENEKYSEKVYICYNEGKGGSCGTDILTTPQPPNITIPDAQEEQAVSLIDIGSLQNALINFWDISGTTNTLDVSQTFCCNNVFYQGVARIRGVSACHPNGQGDDQGGLQMIIPSGGFQNSVPYTRFPFRRDDIEELKWNVFDIAYIPDLYFNNVGSTSNLGDQSWWQNTVFPIGFLPNPIRPEVSSDIANCGV